MLLKKSSVKFWFHVVWIFFEFAFKFQILYHNVKLLLSF
jgi:hypothetical protein